MIRLIFAFLFLARTAAAGAPVVVTDIAPVHGLVARVMAGVGAPVLLLPPGVSPHGYALRPSQARALNRADLVVWVGPALTPWLEKPLASLGGGAKQLELLETAPDLLLRYGDPADGPDGGHDEEADDHHQDHHHEGVDPHAWLDPQVAMRWTEAIAEALSDADPAHAERYATNARQSRLELQALEANLTARLAPLQDRPFVTFHDAYRYLEHRFHLTSLGSVRTGDASGPGAAGIAGLREKIADSGALCAFAEPQFDPALLRAVGEHGDIRIEMLDPMGVGLNTGPDFYPALMRAMADALAGCLGA